MAVGILFPGPKVKLSTTRFSGFSAPLNEDDISPFCYRYLNKNKFFICTLTPANVRVSGIY